MSTTDLTRTLIVAAAVSACATDEPQRDTEPEATEFACAHSAADADTAEHIARMCGHAVEIESARDEYAELFAEPSGLHTLVTSVVAVRARRADGSWGPIDTTLERVGDVLAPVASAAHVRFSVGGDGPFVTLTRDGHTFELSWPGRLPAPSVSGNRATYADALPGVDLVVHALGEGFTHEVIVKTRQAATNLALRRARFRAGGDARLGVHVASIISDESAHASGELALTPNASLLDDPLASFPVIAAQVHFVAPDQWAYTNDMDQNAPTTDTHIEGSDPNPAALQLRVGNDPESQRDFRSFVRFPIGGIAGKQVLAAKISGVVDHTHLCGAFRPNYFYRSAAIAASPRQAWPGPALEVPLGNNNVHANEKSCSYPNMGFEVASANLNNDLQAFANAGLGSYYVAIAAAHNIWGDGETVADRWMRYFTNDFRLHITYNTRPATPDTLTVDNKPCVSGASRPFVKTKTPTLRARVTDADGDTMNLWFAWAQWNGTAFVDVGGGSQANVPNGAFGTFTATAPVDGGIYTFRAQSDDAPSHSPYLVSELTHMPGNCEWEVDISPPAVPTVAADVYLEGPNGCPGGACGSVGQTGRFTFWSSPDTQAYRWGFSDPPTNVLTPPTLGGAMFIDWTPTASGAHTLYVRAIGRAGNERDKVYTFVVAAESTAAARWMLDDAPGSPFVFDETGNAHDAATSAGVLGAAGRIVPGPDGLARSAMQVTGTNSIGAATASPVLADTSKSFSVAAWVKLTDNAGPHRAIDQIGGASSAFGLGYDRFANAWKLHAPSQDGTSFPGPASTTVPKLGVWTHLAGTYDSAARTMKLYVNGTLERTATGITTWDANGSTRIGPNWAGSLAEIQLWSRVVSPAEVFALVDPTVVGRVGQWQMQAIGSGPQIDASPMAHDLMLRNGAVVPPSGAGQSGTGLRLDGVDDHAATDGQVLHTDQSFTISVWARPTTIGVAQTFVAQQSAGANPGFSLGFGPESGGVWKFRVHASATDTTNITVATAPAVAVTTAFHHLVGVFDAQRAELRLYVDGVLRATSPMIAAWQPWDAAGPLLIGRGAAGSEPTAGDLDEIRVYQGAVTNVANIP